MKQFLPLVFALVATIALAQEPQPRIVTGAEQTERYVSLLQNKRIALVVNTTSMIGNTHLVDTLRADSTIDIKRIFAPEHGFRAEADAGADIDNEYDPKTALPIVSIYGKKK